ncbi:penicillin-binding protein 1C [Lentibacter algarum]|uniref:penicillin-binding protein 1C n=1 Tax=Lentibacter algarum TaxID=576131 RepID=UPI001C075F4A|nr:penicillin-binding protein 1C [Lentibacter algarum]MBU2981348.1 penicillin-binding protein 1C [Lentibacter algarum]
MPAVLHETSVEVRDAHGVLLRAFPVEDGRWRLATKPEQVDPAYLTALIAFEDKRFFRHNGVDLRAILRAGWQALGNGRTVSGASTLTMQLARLLENGATGHWSGKLRQMRVALALERTHSKQELLSLYLTHAPFGGNLEGLRSASYAYFGKEPRRLTPAEIALLVALPQAPESRRPDRAAQAAKEARNRVARRLLEEGILTQESYETALAMPTPTAAKPFPALAFHSAEHARKMHPHNSQIALTLDAELQARLETLARKSLLSVEPKASIAMIVAEHKTGAIKAAIGSGGVTQSTVRKGFVDMTRALRSPGSTLKPLVYAAAYDLSLAHPETIIRDEPVRFGSYEPSNFDGRFQGEMTTREALQLSRNIPVITLLEAVGPERFMQRLRQAGAKPDVQGGKAGLAIGLGGMGITLRDLTGLYAGLAQGGKAVRLSEQPEALTDQPSTRFTSASAAWQIGDILSTVPLPNARKSHGIAYKTGTSYGYRDNWAVGYDGEHVIGVWIGRPDGTPMQTSFARETAAPLLAKAFQYLKSVPVPLGPAPAETLTVSTAELPEPLQRFTTRGSLVASAKGQPEIVFPPRGVRLAQLPDTPVMLKLRGGVPPFAVLTNGAVTVTEARASMISLGTLEPGFFTLSVVDSQGRSAQTEFELR